MMKLIQEMEIDPNRKDEDPRTLGKSNSFTT